MARKEDRERAIKLRQNGYSYSEIKNKLDVSKSTLSSWLRDMPLSKKRLDELQRSEQVIEKIRQTKLRKKQDRLKRVYEKVAADIENCEDVALISGFYLYWGEGTKTADYTVSFTNSDPSMVRCFIEWMERLGVERSLLRVKLHLYSDQDEVKLKKFWSKVTNIPVKNFNKSYIKQSSVHSKTYKGVFGNGTCVVAYHDRDMREYVLEGIHYLRDKYS